VVSRGELIEIGDGFRIPEIMEQSGAILHEVGTTNRTRAEDYEKAITENTALLLRVHPSNFSVSGFTEKPSLEELVALSERSGVPIVEDLGSGCLVDLRDSRIAEPTAGQSIKAGVSVVLFSGDKLLGGPQAGIVAGKKDLIARIRRHPLFRALRVDKLTITALEVTLNAYLRGDYGAIPALNMIRATPQELGLRAASVVRTLHAGLTDSKAVVEIVDGFSLAGGGSTPSQSLPTKLIKVRSASYSASQLEQRLRQPGSSAMFPVIARVEDELLLLDLRTVFADQDHLVTSALQAALM
jgi:L-seryl-tRNA(Ser) seleniumtransferase